MGAEGVGKTSLVRRFLYNSFQHRHIPTVEELYARVICLTPEISVRVSILDTSGTDQFPAMRRHAIQSCQAILLVYSLACPASLQFLKLRLQEILEMRGGQLDLPVVLVGNKVDLCRGRYHLSAKDGDWLDDEFPGHNIPLLECSARENKHVTNVFQTFFKLSPFAPMINNIMTQKISRTISLKSPDLYRKCTPILEVMEKPRNSISSPWLCRRNTWNIHHKKRSSSCLPQNKAEAWKAEPSGVEAYLEPKIKHSHIRSPFVTKKRITDSEQPLECKVS